MRKFIISCLVFSLLVLMIFYIKPLYLVYTDRYKKLVNGDEIYYVIQKSKLKNKKYKKILFGDSVGNQLFRCVNNNGDINSLTSLASTSMVGNFILLNNYLKAGNQIDTVYMIFRAQSFSENLNDCYTFHYFLKPFYTEENQSEFSDIVKIQIEKIPFHEFCREPYILSSNWAPKFTSKDIKDFTFLSPITAEYLIRIKKLCCASNIKLIILPAPLSNTQKEFIRKINKNEIVVNDLETEFESYFNNIIYLNDTCFSDGVHFKPQYVQYYNEYYRKNLMK